MAKLDLLFKLLIAQGGSDLHLEQGRPPKMRVNGHLKNIDGYEVLTQTQMEEWMSELTTPEAWIGFQERGDFDFAYALGQDARFRINYFRHFFGLGAICRIIPSKIKTLEQLSMPDTLKKFGELNSGLVLVTGPTGSGKSTTLAAIIDYINENKQKKIITIEEPVEFMHPNKKCMIVHREVGLDTESFASGLRGAIKSDVDIILVGEMRDQETINLALTATQMGILVFGTLHTNSASKTIDRIIDVFPAAKKNQVRVALANTLQGVVSQQLLRSVDGNRRWVAYEILLRTQALGSIIQQGETNKLISEMQLNTAIGMVEMDTCLLRMVKEGKVSKEDAYLKALNKPEFKLEMERL